MPTFKIWCAILLSYYSMVTVELNKVSEKNSEITALLSSTQERDQKLKALDLKIYEEP